MNETSQHFLTVRLSGIMTWGLLRLRRRADVGIEHCGDIIVNVKWNYEYKYITIVSAVLLNICLSILRLLVFHIRKDNVVSFIDNIFFGKKS